jgi:hypothetical protein
VDALRDALAPCDAVRDTLPPRDPVRDTLPPRDTVRDTLPPRETDGDALLPLDTVRDGDTARDPDFDTVLDVDTVLLLDAVDDTWGSGEDDGTGVPLMVPVLVGVGVGLRGLDVPAWVGDCTGFRVLVGLLDGVMEGALVGDLEPVPVGAAAASST